MGKESRVRELKELDQLRADSDRSESFEFMLPVHCPDPAHELIKKFNSIPAIALTVSEVCEMFNISRSTLYRANLPGKVIIGGSIRYDKNQLLSWWFEQQKKG